MFFFAPFFAVPALYILGIYVLAAVLPAVFLLRYIYRKDTVEPEPPLLLIRLLFMGVIAALISIVLESLGESILNALVDPGSPWYTVLLAFFVVALVEEETKFLFLHARTWRNPNFNYRFDGIVYAVFVSLGFAAFENIQYVLHYGLSVALPRAIFAVPGHMSFAVFMGLFYGRAKLYEAWGDRRRCRGSLIRAYGTSVLLHGFYDACAMRGTGMAMVVFLVFVVLMFRSAFKHVKQESFTDEPV